MSYKIIVDSCCELPGELLKDSRFEIVSLGLEVGDYHIMDDENFDQKVFLEKVASCPVCPKSSCPSPEKYMQAYDTEAEDVYVVTLSSKLSGSHNSAELGRNLYLEKNKKNIYVCDSQSASCGEAQIALKAMEFADTGMPFAEVVKKLEAYRDAMNTYFVLDNLETLRKNGRLTGVKALVASTLSIKPVMGAIKGSIVQRAQAIGIKKALMKMVDIIVKENPVTVKTRLMITHCNCADRAEEVKRMILEKAQYTEIIILDTKGISSMYANDGGIIIAV